MRKFFFKDFYFWKYFIRGMSCVGSLFPDKFIRLDENIAILFFILFAGNENTRKRIKGFSETTTKTPAMKKMKSSDEMQWVWKPAET